MKRRPTHSFEDVLKATGPEWEEVPRGFKLEILDEPLQAERDRLTIRLPPDALDAFRPRAGDRLRARVVRGKLIVEREAARVSRKSSRA